MIGVEEPGGVYAGNVPETAWPITSRPVRVIPPAAFFACVTSPKALRPTVSLPWTFAVRCPACHTSAAGCVVVTSAPVPS